MGEIPLRRRGDAAEPGPGPGLGTFLREKGGKVAGVLLVLLLAAGYAAWQGTRDLREGVRIETGDGTGAASPSPGTGVDAVGEGSPAPSPEPVRVQIVGAVAAPGIYSVAKGAYLEDLVRLAGGFTAAADVERINLVWRIDRSLLIRIGERTQTGAPPGTTGVSGAGAAVQVTDQVSFQEGEGGGETTGPLDLNAATVAQLDALPGIGPSVAAAIVAYREKNGPFRRAEDLMKVSGIKQSRFDAVKDLVTVG